MIMVEKVKDLPTGKVCNISINVKDLQPVLKGRGDEVGENILHLLIPVMPLPHVVLSDEIIDLFKRNEFSEADFNALNEKAKYLIQKEMLVRFIAHRIIG